MPGAPAASGGGSATCRRPHPHCTSCRSCWIVTARASGKSVTWWENRTPRSAAPARSPPHAQEPCGKCAIISSGSSRQARNAPGAPGCLPGLRPPRRVFRSGGLRPGRSSLLGGIDELPLFREISRSSRAIRSRSSAFSAFSSSFSARSRPAAACSAATTTGASGGSGMPALHQSQPCVSNTTRTASRQRGLCSAHAAPMEKDQGPECLRQYVLTSAIQQ